MARILPLIGLFTGLTLFGASSPNHRFFINTRQSMPAGIYYLTTKSPKLGDLAIVTLSEELSRFATKTSWLTPHAPLIKRIAATSGATLCVTDDVATLDGRFIGTVKVSDDDGVLLPRIKGCVSAKQNEVFVLGDNASHSFDSRYFGPVDEKLIRGKATLLFGF